MNLETCSVCGERYPPDPRTVGHQKTCKRRECRAERKRRADQNWRWRHPGRERSEQRKAYRREWNKNNPDYYRDYRAAKSEYRARERERMARKRSGGVAKPDGTGQAKLVEELKDVRVLARETVAKQDAMREILVGYLKNILDLAQESVAKQDAITSRLDVGL